MSMQIGKPVSSTYTAATQSQVRVAKPTSTETPLETGKPIQTQESFGAARQSVVGKSTETVNPSQGGAQLKQGINQVEPDQLLEQGQSLMESPVVRQEFNDEASALTNMSQRESTSSLSAPTGRAAITSDLLLNARQSLKAVSQHQVLNLEKADTAVTESSRSIVLKDQGSSFAPERLSSKSTLEIVGHGASNGTTVGGLTPQQLANKLKSSGIKQLAVLDLKSCYSNRFKAELEKELKLVGINVGEIRSYEGQIAISRDSGKAMQGDGLEQIQGHDGMLGLFPYGVQVSDALQGMEQAFNQAVQQTRLPDAIPHLAGTLVALNDAQANPEQLRQVTVEALRTITAAHGPAAANGFARELFAQVTHNQPKLAPAVGAGCSSWAWEQKVDTLLAKSAPKATDSEILAGVRAYVEDARHYRQPRGLLDAAKLVQRLNQDGEDLIAEAFTGAKAMNQPNLMLRALTMSNSSLAEKSAQASEVFGVAMDQQHYPAALQAVQYYLEIAAQGTDATLNLLKATSSLTRQAAEKNPEVVLEAVQMLQECARKAAPDALAQVFTNHDFPTPLIEMQTLQVRAVASVVNRGRELGQPQISLNALHAMRELSQFVDPNHMGRALGITSDKIRSTVVNLAKIAIQQAVTQRDVEAAMDGMQFLKEIAPNDQGVLTQIVNNNRSLLEQSPHPIDQLNAVRNLAALANSVPADVLACTEPPTSKDALQQLCFNHLKDNLVPRLKQSQAGNAEDLLVDSLHVLSELTAAKPTFINETVNLAKYIVEKTSRMGLCMEATQVLHGLLEIVPDSQRNALKAEISEAARSTIKKGLEKNEPEQALAATQLLRELVLSTHPDERAAMLPAELQNAPAFNSFVNDKTKACLAQALEWHEPEVALAALEFLVKASAGQGDDGLGGQSGLIVTKSQAAITLALNDREPVTALAALQFLTETCTDREADHLGGQSGFLIDKTKAAIALALDKGDPDTALEALGHLGDLAQVHPPSDMGEYQAFCRQNLQAIGKLALHQQDFEVALDAAQMLVDYQDFNVATHILQSVKAQVQEPAFTGFGFANSIEEQDREQFRSQNLITYKPAGEASLTDAEKDKLSRFSDFVCNCVHNAYSDLVRGDFPAEDVYKSRDFVTKGHGLAAAKMGYTIESQVMLQLKRQSVQVAGGLYKYPSDAADDQAIFWRDQGSMNLAKSTRPDIFIVMNPAVPASKREALLDLTSQKQKGHILFGKTPNWLSPQNICFVREVTYPSFTKGQIQHIKNNLLRGGAGASDLAQLANQIAMTQVGLDKSQQEHQKKNEEAFVRQVLNACSSANEFASSFFGGDKTTAAKFVKAYGIKKRGISESVAKPTPAQLEQFKKTFAEAMAKDKSAQQKIATLPEKPAVIPFDRYLK